MKKDRDALIEVYAANLNIYNSGNLFGFRLKLPMDEKDLKSQLESMLNGDEDCIILDAKTPFKCKIDKNSDILKLNRQLQKIRNVNPDTLEAISEYDDLTLDEIVDIVESKRYEIYKNIENEKDLGYELYKKNQLSFSIPQNLIKYIDFAAIGHDERIKKSIRLIPEMRIAERIMPAAN